MKSTRNGGMAGRKPERGLGRLPGVSVACILIAIEYIGWTLDAFDAARPDCDGEDPEA